MTFSEAQIADVKARTDLAGLAISLGAALRRSGQKFIGSCPVCGGGKRATRFEVKGAGWVCAVCPGGGDAIALVRKVTGCGFAEAVERLGGARVMTAAEEARAKAAAAAREQRRAADAEKHRQREISAAHAIWQKGVVPVGHGPLALYLAARGIEKPASARLREAFAIPYFHGTEEGREHPRCIHRGPAMLAAITGDAARFMGVHITWLSPDGGKAEIADPETGEVLPAKKMRGSKAGGKIVLRHPFVAPARLFLAEGIETGLSVAVALKRQGKLQPGDAFWAAGDLGNLGGPAAETVAHPVLKTPAGRPQRIPGPDPGDGAAIVIPDSVTTLVLLGDGDSEEVLTRHALERAKRRYTRAGRKIAVAMAAQGQDFNDMMRAA